jgi:hypothetical protein
MSRIQDIFRDHASAYLERYGDVVPEAHRRVIRAVCDCRSGACGHHEFACPDCGQTHWANSSCGNRHCPICQNAKAAEWVWRQQERILPCTYFLATFTVPPGLHALAQKEARVVYDALLDEAGASLRTLEADPRFVGCHVAGFFAVLHTWGRQLQYHPHVHVVIPGGGLDEKRTRWVAARGDFLVHVRALSRLFRGKLRARLDALGLLDQVPGEVWTQDWVVHCEAVGDGRATMTYLGAYVFRVAVSEARVESYDGGQVTFRYQKVGSAKWRRCTVSAMEFMRRFLQHVLPKGFVKIRHSGFLSPNFAVPLQRIRELICLLYETLRDQLPALVKPEKLRPLRCPKCQAVMQWIRFHPPRVAGVT